MNITFKTSGKIDTAALSHLHMDVISINHCVLDQTWHSSAAKAPFTRVYIPLGGEGTLICGGETVTMRPGMIYLIPTGADLQFSCNSHLEKVYAHILIPQNDHQDLFFGQNRCAILPDKQNIATQIAAKCTCKTIADTLFVKSILFNIAAQAMDYFGIDHTLSKGFSPMVNAAIHYIDKHLSAKLTAQNIADDLYISIHSLQRHFRQEVGVTLGKYISNRVVNAAAYALYSRKQSIKQISQSLGFCDQFYFSRVFSAHYGTTPSEYRKKAMPDGK